jgi:hypothetical protein
MDRVEPDRVLVVGDDVVDLDPEIAAGWYGMPLGVGQGSRSTPAVRPYRRRQRATTTRE